MILLGVGKRHGDRDLIQKRRVHAAGQKIVAHVKMQGVLTALAVLKQRCIQSAIFIGDAACAGNRGTMGEKIDVKTGGRQTAVLIEDMRAQSRHCHYRVMEKIQLSVPSSLPGFFTKGKPDMSVTLETLNHLPEAQFVSQLEGLYEHSPWVVRDIAGQRPFTGRDALIDAAQAHIRQASARAQHELICAHPELGSRQLDRLSAASRTEQRDARLAEDQARLEQLRSLNEAYRQRHGFPFVVAVAGMTPEAIISTLETRLPRDSSTEISESLTQIGYIARQRLTRLLETD